MSKASTLSNTAPANASRIAVIGAGLAGLSAAWLLKQKYQVTLFESHASPGMGVYTNDYHSNGIHTRVDIPLRIFTKGYYPELFSLYKHLGVEMESSDHSAVYQYLNLKKEKRPKAFFQYHNRSFLNKEFNFPNTNTLTFKGLHLTLGHFRFFKKIKADSKNRLTLSGMTFGEYVNKNKFNTHYINDILLPALSVTCTCDYQAILNYPCDLIVEYLTCGVMDEGIVRAKLGVDDIVPRLTQGYQVKCYEQVLSVEEKTETHNTIKLTSKNTQTNVTSLHEFDYVIIATQANIAHKILSKNTLTPQARLLSDIPMQESSMVLHTDTDQVYHAQKASPVSYIIDKTQDRPSTSVDLTKAFSSYKKQAPIYQTWNPIKPPKESHILNQAHFTRPLVTLQSRQSVTQLMALNKHSSIKICGSYMANKIPLLDAAVASSISIAKELGCPIPWEQDTDNQVEPLIDVELAY
mgnify:CR=1 FL=1